MKKENYKLLITFSLLFVLLSGIWFYFVIYSPAKMSTQHSCGVIETEELNEMGYFVAGSYNPVNDTITLNVIDSDYSVSKHEHCHRVQEYENRLYNCIIRPLRLMNEMECYLSEKLPDFIYYLRYGEISY